MAADIVDLRSFYAEPLGALVNRLISRIVRTRWDRCVGSSLLGIGYPTPYLDVFRNEAMRLLAFMPAEQGVVNWPAAGPSASALIEPGMLPLPDATIDRIVLVHALEGVQHPRELLSEVWRILTPGGRMIAVVPSRRGLWARFDTTPFGYGQLFSKTQLRELLRDTLFSPIHWSEALYMPPIRRRAWVASAPIIERMGSALGWPFAGVYLVEATKQLYRPVLSRKLAKAVAPQLKPVLLPAARADNDDVPEMKR